MTIRIVKMTAIRQQRLEFFVRYDDEKEVEAFTKSRESGVDLIENHLILNTKQDDWEFGYITYGGRMPASQPEADAGVLFDMCPDEK